MIPEADTFIINTRKFISSSLGDEIMLMNLETGDYVGLNVVSADIWKQATNPTNTNQIVEYLLQQYDVEESVCRAEVLSCIEKMMEKELLLKV